MDFSEGFPSSGGVNVIFIVVDILSKYDHFFKFKASFQCY